MKSWTTYLSLAQVIVTVAVWWRAGLGGGAITHTYTRHQLTNSEHSETSESHYKVTFTTLHTVQMSNVHILATSNNI